MSKVKPKDLGDILKSALVTFAFYLMCLAAAFSRFHDSDGSQLPIPFIVLIFVLFFMSLRETAFIILTLGKDAEGNKP